MRTETFCPRQGAGCVDMHNLSVSQNYMLPCGLHLAACDSGTLQAWLALVVMCGAKYTLGSKIPYEKKECKISQYFSYHLYEELITFWIYWVKEDTWLKQMLCISLLIWLLGNLKAHTWLALVSHTLFLWHYSRGHFLLKLLTVSGPSQAVTSPMISKSEVVYYKLPGAETWHWSAQCVPSIWQPVGLAK